MNVKTRMGYYYNLLSAVGIVLVLVGAGLMLVFFAVGAISGFAGAYTGLLVYFAFPAVLVIGLFLIPIGVYREKKRRSGPEGEKIPPYPKVDFNDSRQRRKVIFFALATIGFLLILSVAVIQGYHYTESTAFCGKLCHTVMEPEYTAWSNSPHARVKCAQCHIGPGAEWFVKTKLSGLRQVYKVLTRTWPAPITTPVENLRPARDTCEQCHWPENFYSGRYRNFYHYASDRNNSPRELTLLLKTGGVYMSPIARGIHWHIGTEVFYHARDTKRQDIPYVRVREKDGTVTEYMDTENPPDGSIGKTVMRKMDCVDCHNRPTHIFRPPGPEMDENFVSGHIDRSLPFIRKVSVDLLSRPHKTREEAYAAISAGIREYYRTNHPKISQAKSAEIERAVKHVQEIYGRNFFPRMKTAWNTHIDNISHLLSPGCFRCHDGKHRSKEGRVISKDCNLCHQVVGQKQENIPPGTQVRDFVHPVDIGDELMNTNCSECHI